MKLHFVGKTAKTALRQWRWRLDELDNAHFMPWPSARATMPKALELCPCHCRMSPAARRPGLAPGRCAHQSAFFARHAGAVAFGAGGSSWVAAAVMGASWRKSRAMMPENVAILMRYLAYATPRRLAVVTALFIALDLQQRMAQAGAEQLGAEFGHRQSASGRRPATAARGWRVAG